MDTIPFQEHEEKLARRVVASVLAKKLAERLTMPRIRGIVEASRHLTAAKLQYTRAVNDAVNEAERL